MTGTTRGSEGAGRAVDVLLTFAEAETLGVSEIARSTGLAKSVVHRILQTLVDRGFAAPTATGRGYRLGSAVAALGTIANLRQADLRIEARPILERLRDATGETATLSQRVGRGRIFADQVLSVREILMTVTLGRAYPLTVGATGKAILASLPSPVAAAIIDADTAGADAATLQSELTVIRKRGFATSFGQRNPEAAAAAAPIFDRAGDVIGAISVCGPSMRLDGRALDGMAPAVRSAARELSAALGAPDGAHSQIANQRTPSALTGVASEA